MPPSREAVGRDLGTGKDLALQVGLPKALGAGGPQAVAGLVVEEGAGEIANPRLETLTEKTMRWSFKIEHVAGARNFGLDALSRYPARPKAGVKSGVVARLVDAEAWLDEVESAVLANVRARAGVQVVSWEVLQSTGISDREYSGLLHVLGTDGVSSPMPKGSELPQGPGSAVVDPVLWWEELREYAGYRSELSVLDGVVVFRGQVVVPRVLRREVLDALHRAHQGVSGMALRAGERVWWPGITADLQRVRDMCGKCIANTPSQPPAPPKPLPRPKYPFELMAADYFAYGGNSYLVAVDRYSSWPIVAQSKTDSAEELVKIFEVYSAAMVYQRSWPPMGPLCSCPVRCRPF